MRKKKNDNKLKTVKSSILQRNDEILLNFVNKELHITETNVKVNVINKELENLNKSLALNNVNNNQIEIKNIKYKINELNKKLKELSEKLDDINSDKSSNEYLLNTFMIINKYIELEEVENELLLNEDNIDDPRDIPQLLYKVNIEKRYLTDEYYTILDPNYVSNANNRFGFDLIYCKNCNTYLTVESGFAICHNCGSCFECLHNPTELSYKEQQEVDYRPQFKYDKRTHLDEWIRRFQAKENKEISQDVLDKVILEARKEKVFDLNKLDEKKVKKYLKKLNFNIYYDNIIAIINRINKRPPFVLTLEIENKIRDMFQQMQEPFEKYKKSRKNMLSYGYILNKYFLILDLPEFSKYFFLLKSPEKLRLQDEIFKKIVDHMAQIDPTTKWRFFPSL